MSLQVGDTFPSIQAAKDAIRTVLAESKESWKATSDKTRFNISSILAERNAIADAFMSTNLLVLMELLQQCIGLRTH